MVRVKSEKNSRLQSELASLATGFGSHELRVGWFENSRYDDTAKTLVAVVAARNEFGSTADNVPPRPFMRPTVKRDSKRWGRIIANGTKKILAGSSSVEQVLHTLGLVAQGGVQKSITQLYTPPLAAATIAARLLKREDKQTIGNLTKPLIDFRVMLNSLTYTVSKNVDTG